MGSDQKDNISYHQSLTSELASHPEQQIKILLKYFIKNHIFTLKMVLIIFIKKTLIYITDKRQGKNAQNV